MSRVSSNSAIIIYIYDYLTYISDILEMHSTDSVIYLKLKHFTNDSEIEKCETRNIAPLCILCWARVVDNGPIFSHTMKSQMT